MAEHHGASQTFEVLIGSNKFKGEKLAQEPHRGFRKNKVTRSSFSSAKLDLIDARIYGRENRIWPTIP